MFNNQTTSIFRFWLFLPIVSLSVVVGCRPQEVTIVESEVTEPTTENTRTFWKIPGRVSIENNPNFTYVFQKAIKKRRPIFISFYSEWCETCPYMNDEIIQQSSFNYYLENEFVSFLVDAETMEGNKLAQEYQVVAYPTVLFLNSEGQEISKHIGVVSENKVMQLAKSAVIAEDRFQKMKERQRR
jgi:thiol:disulfide interchange protein